MPISTREARERILGDIAAAVDAMAFSLACLSEAFEQLSVGAADRMEGELYRPVQKAFGRGKRTHSQFAERVAMEGREFETPSIGRKTQGAKSFVEQAVVAAQRADAGLSELQDSMAPIEAGDAELRAGLNEVRELLAVVPGNAREFLRTLGR